MAFKLQYFEKSFMAGRLELLFGPTRALISRYCLFGSIDKSRSIPYIVADNEI